MIVGANVPALEVIDGLALVGLDVLFAERLGDLGHRGGIVGRKDKYLLAVAGLDERPAVLEAEAGLAQSCDHLLRLFAGLLVVGHHVLEARIVAQRIVLNLLHGAVEESLGFLGVLGEHRGIPHDHELSFVVGNEREHQVETGVQRLHRNGLRLRFHLVISTSALGTFAFAGVFRPFALGLVDRVLGLSLDLAGEFLGFIAPAQGRDEEDQRQRHGDANLAVTFVGAHAAEHTAVQRTATGGRPGPTGSNARFIVVGSLGGSSTGDRRTRNAGF